MKQIIIKNIGAINNVDLTLNRVNVLMGPQSSGKSTIAKIISYCQWVEKRFLIDRKFEYSFSEMFLDFHKIDINYFSDDSLIEYISDSVHLTYKGKKFDFDIKLKNNGEKFLNHKNIYIPSERNFVSVIPNLGKYKESNDNVMNFVYDWFEAKKNYPKKNNYSILNLGVSYHSEEDSDDKDKILLNNNKKEISLNNSSSGLQSLTPLLILVDYLSKHIFKQKNVLTAEQKQLQNSILDPIERINQRLLPLLKSNDEKKRNEAEKISLEIKKLEENTKKQIDRYLRYQFTQFIIEEPEQNLFPTTQRDLIYHLISNLLNNKRKHSVFITTHSPYVLYALNNCIMGYNVRRNIPKEEYKEFLSRNSWINSDLVSVWEIDKSKGGLKNIKNEKTGTIDKHYFNEVMNEIMDEYYHMLDYLEV